MPENFDNIPEHSYKKDEYLIGPFGRKRDNFPRNYLSPITDFVFNLYDKPATWLHDKVIVPNRKQSVYYHWKFPRVPTVDECYVDDYACLYEADMQYKRDRMVEQNIIRVLDRRVLDCEQAFGGIESSGSVEWCREVKKDLEDAQTNYMIKYGELPSDGTARLNLMEAKTRSADVYLKQKHRYIWERRQQMKAKQEQLDKTQESD